MPNSISLITRYRDACKGWDNSADAPSLALDWNREWLIPASTNAWFPVKIFKDVAMPGVYTVTVTGSTNIIVRYGDTCVRGGQSEEVSFPLAQSQETLEVQAAAPGAAALTVSFTGSGLATNYTCSTYVNIKAWGVELDDGGINTGIPALDGINAYVPGSRRTGFVNGTNVWQTMVCVTSPQSVDISLPNLGTESGVTRIELTLSDVTQLTGWCVNGRFLSGSQNGDDFSFAAGDDLRTITVTTEAQSNHGNPRQIGVSSARLKLFCKDTGGTCVLTAKPYDGDNVLLGTVTVTVPLDVNNNGIADAWERDKIVEHNGVYPGAPLTWSPALFADTGGDDEPAALGNRRTDGSYSHADTGDGLIVFQEYRGYEVDGGAGFTSTRHIRLSPALKELLVQVNELPGMASQPSFNPAALSAYNFSFVMQQVAQFYCHPTRGLGIDLYWCRRDFTAFGEQFTPDSNLSPISPHRYRFNGNLFDPNNGIFPVVQLPDGGNAVSYTQAHALEKQGSCVSVVAMADETYKTQSGTWIDYSASQFINQLVWATAHELGHLLTSGHITDPSGHLADANVLMTDVNPVPAGITAITASGEELEKVDLKTRFSVPH